MQMVNMICLEYLHPHHLTSLHSMKHVSEAVLDHMWQAYCKFLSTGILHGDTHSLARHIFVSVSTSTPRIVLLDFDCGSLIEEHVSSDSYAPAADEYITEQQAAQRLCRKDEVPQLDLFRKCKHRT